MSIQLTSKAFQDGQTIPARFTADGSNTSPPISWPRPPEGTRSFALLCEDPDAPRGTFTHWVVYNVPAESQGLSEGVPRQSALSSGAVQGTNDFGRFGYAGPAPPAGKPHRYVFKLYAVDQPIMIEPGATREQLLSAIAGHVVDEGHLTGKYER